MQGNTIEILNSINMTVANIAKMMAPQNLSGPKGIATLSKGVNAPAQKTSNIDVKMSSSTVDSIKAMSSISPVVLSFKDINLNVRQRMVKTIKAVVESLTLLYDFDKTHSDMGNVMRRLVRSTNDVTGVVYNVNNGIERNKGAFTSIIGAVAGMTAVTAAMIGLGSLLNGPNGWNIILKGLGGMVMVLTSTLAVIGLTAIASRLIISTDGIRGIGLMLAYTVASMGLIVASKFLGDFVTKNNKDILKGLGYAGGVLLGLGVLGITAGKVLGHAKTGIVALGTVELMAAGAMGLVVAVAKLSDYLKQYEVKDLANTVLGIGGVVSAFGVLAGIAGIGPVAAAIAVGSIALGAVEAMAFGAIKLVTSVVGLHTKKDEIGVSWKDLEKDVLGVSGIVGTFGTLAAAASLLSIPIAIATPALLAVSGFSVTCIGIMNKLFDLEKKIREGGSIENLKTLVGTDIPGVVKGFTYKNYNPDLSLVQIASLTAKYGAISLLSLEFLGTAKALSKLANIGSLMKGKMIMPVKRVDKETGEMTLGEPVDIIATANSITGVVKAFADNCTFGFKDVAKMLATAGVFKILSTIVNPVTKFINMLTGFIGSGGSSLTPVKMDEQGNIHLGETVDVAQVAGIISGTISTFVSTLYSDENAGKWTQYVFGRENGGTGIFKNKKTRAIKKVAGILGTVVSPISDFMDILTTMQGDATGNTLTPFTVDAEGNIVAGKPIEVASTANVISNAITKFVSGLFTDANVETWNGLERKGRKALETVFTSLSDLIGVVKDLGNEKSINNKNLEANISSVQKLLNSVYVEDFEKASEKMTTFSNSTIQLKSNISNLDKVLIEENNKRKKNIEDFGNSIESMLKKFENADKSIGTLYQLIVALQNMDANHVSSIISSMNLNNYNNNSGISPAQGSTQQVSGAKQNITAEDIVQAIKSALDGMHIMGGSVSESQCSDDSLNAIISALRDVRLDIDVN